MVKAFHSSTIRRPRPEDHNTNNFVPSQEMSLDDFYNNHVGTPIQEVYDVDPFDVNSTSEYTTQSQRERTNATAFRRRHPIDDNTQLRSDNYNSFGNDNTQHPNNVHMQPSREPKSKPNNLTWNKLNTTLFIGHALLSAATSIPLTLVPTMARSLAVSTDEQWTYYTFDNGQTSLEVYDENGTRKWWIPFQIRTRNKQNNGTASGFASRLAVVGMFAQSLGKFINGPLVDISGARRLLVIYGTCTFLALIGLKHSYTAGGAIACCALVEFFSSVFWPCAIVVLGAHYGISDVSRGGSGPSDGRFERGVNVTSIASRCGSLLAMPLSSLLLKWSSFTWRDIAGLASMSALSGVAVLFFFLTDSPGKLHDPQNPIRMIPQSWHFNVTVSEKIIIYVTCAFNTVMPSLRTVLGSRVFWMLAAAHSGATMVKSSERILGTYYVDTSYGMSTEGKAGAMTVFLPLGMLGGLVLGGRAFARAADEERAIEDTKKYTNTRPQYNPGVEPDISTLFINATQLRPKNMIAFLYCLAICMCYMLSFLAMPFIRRALVLPEIVLILQVLVSMGLGAGVAVQYYHIPVVVGATYGHNRGLYQSYTDGVAAFVSSIVWRLVGSAVEEGDPESYGWAYGWAAVALLLILCGTLMIAIMEVYFVGGGWRHHLIHYDRRLDESFPSELPKDCSWMEDEIMSTGLSLEDTSITRHGGIRNLSTSAYEFISPQRPSRMRQSFLTIVDSRDEEDASRVREADLLGIDDDGSILHPMRDSTKQDFYSTLSNQKLVHPPRPFDAESSTEISGEYLSFAGMKEPAKKCQLTFTKSEDETSVRATSTFDYPESTVEDANTGMYSSRDNREAKTPSPIESFSL
jgi:MFS family permease